MLAYQIWLHRLNGNTDLKINVLLSRSVEVGEKIEFRDGTVAQITEIDGGELHCTEKVNYGFPSSEHDGASAVDQRSTGKSGSGDPHGSSRHELSRHGG